MAFTQDFRTQRRNYNDGESRIGEKDRLWYDSNTNSIRISDGETPGGVAVGGSGGGDYTLPTATTTVKGGVKVDGTTITISNQVISGFSGSYNDLTNKPTLFNGAYDSLSGKPTLFSGSYADLTNKPTLFSGSYTDLTDKPNLASTYTFNVAADDSTLRTIGTEETVKFIGANGITTGSDAEGAITITQGTTSSLVNGASTVSLSSTGTLSLPNNGKISSGVSIAPVGSSFSYAQNAFGSISDTGGVFLPSDTNSRAIVAGYTLVSNAGVTLTVTSISIVAGPPSFVSVSTTPTASSFTYPVTVYSADYVAGYTAPEWQFGTNGSLTFPNGTTQTTAAESFSFSVAADDSTQRAISNNELIKFIGAGGITTASDAEGNITITGSGGAYTLPTATDTVLGGVKIDGTTITINGSGVITANYPDTLAELTDTNVAGASNNQVLTWNTSTGKWIPTTVNGVDTLPTGIAYYGSFYDITATQTATSQTTAYVVNIGETTEANGVSIVSGNRITFAYAGTYEIEFSIQFHNVDNQGSDVNVWFRKNGSDIADSNSRFTIPSKSNNNGYLIAVTPYLVTVAAGDYVQIVWSAEDNTTTKIETLAAGTTPTVPRTPGVIVLVNPVTSLIAPTTVASLTVIGDISTGTISFTDNTVQETAWTGVADYNNLTNKPSIPAAYTFNVAADDSTLRTIGTEETVKFIGAGGITTASDAEGAITITQGSTDQIIKVAGSFASDQPFKSEVIADLVNGVTINTWMGLPAFATTKSWKFGYNGNLTFPDTTVQTTAWTGSVSYTNVTDKPTLFSGSYTDLTDKPTLFSGSYNDLTNKPTIPSDVSDLTDNNNLLGGSGGDLVAGNYVVKAVKGGSAQTVTSGSDAIVTFVDDFDPQNWFSSNKFQPNVAGYYSIDTHVWWDAGAVTDNQSNIQLRKNGTTQVAISQNQILTGSGYAQSISTIVYFNGTTDYVEVTAFTGNTTSQNINGAGTGTYFTAALYAYGTFSGSYNDLTNKPTIPTNVSQLVNDSGYVTASAIPAQFTFNVAADDSTQRTVGSQETVKFIGAGGITTASDAEGNITITQGSSSSVFSNQYSLTTTTSNATETELLVNGSTRIPVSTNTSINYIINIAARRTDTAGDYAMFEIRGVAANVAGTVTDIGSVYEVVVARTNAGYLVDVRADDTNNSVNVYVTGVSGHTVDWKAVAQTIEV